MDIKKDNKIKQANDIINNKIIADGKLNATLEKLEHIDEVYDLIDGMKEHPLNILNIKTNDKYYNSIDKRIKKQIRGIKLDCREGCSSCCHNISFLVSPVEIENIIDSLNKIKDDDKQIIGTKIESLQTKFKEYSKDRVTTNSNEYMASLRERQRNIVYDCPFLIDDRCSIYNSRPVICRVYLSSSKEICEDTKLADNILSNILKDSMEKMHYNDNNKLNVDDNTYLDVIVPFFVIRYNNQNKKFYSIIKYNKFVAYIQSKIK